MTNLTWRKSSYSGYNGNCPEFAVTSGNYMFTGEAADAYAQGRIDGAAAERHRIIRGLLDAQRGPFKSTAEVVELIREQAP